MSNAIALRLPASWVSDTSVSKIKPTEPWSRITGAVSSFIVRSRPQETIELPIANQEVRQLESMLTEILQQLDSLRLEDTLPLEQDIWAPAIPKHTFTFNVPIDFQGKSQPTFFVDWIEEDE